MSAWNPIGIFMLLVSWVIIAGIAVFVIRYAINTSRLTGELTEVKRELQQLRHELKLRAGNEKEDTL